MRGYLDSITDRALVGWIANLGCPERLEPVVCTGSNGRTLTFYPFMPRQDVCDAFRVTGRFGFAIPLAGLAELGGGTVTLSDAEGTPLGGGEAIPLPVVAAPEREPSWVVLHIQKTAGTSLRAALAGAAREGEALFLYPDGFIGLSAAELGSLPGRQRQALRLVMGHTYFGIGDLLPGRPDYVTFLREPMARLRSHYLHHFEAGSRLSVGGRAVELAAAVSDGLTDEFDNLMVRVLAGADPARVPVGTLGEAEVERALRHVRERFRFVGLTERMVEHCRVLRGMMGLPPVVPPVENTCRVPDAAAALSLVDWERVAHNNRFDAMLYERARDEGLCGRDLEPLRRPA